MIVPKMIVPIPPLWEKLCLCGSMYFFGEWTDTIPVSLPVKLPGFFLYAGGHLHKYNKQYNIISLREKLHAVFFSSPKAISFGRDKSPDAFPQELRMLNNRKLTR